MIIDPFLEKERGGGTLAVERRYKWENLLNLGCQDSIYFAKIIWGECFFPIFWSVFHVLIKTFKFFILYFVIS